MYPFNTNECLFVRRVKNGFVVEPPLRGDYRDPQDIRVFTDAEKLAIYVRGWAENETQDDKPAEPKDA